MLHLCKRVPSACAWMLTGLAGTKKVKARWRRFRIAAGRKVRHVVLKQVTMFDDVNTDLIPPWAAAVAGYVGGNWPTYSTLAAKFPKAKHRLSIAIAADENAEALDIEQGDATIEQAAGWFKLQAARGVKRPAFYIAVSQAQTLVNTLAAVGIKRWQYRLITAHYSYRRHFCDHTCGFGLLGRADATQWTDKALDRNLDETICNKQFFA